MRKRQKLNFLLPVTLLVAAIIVLSVSVCVKRTHDKMTQYSFDELAAKTRSVADDFYNATQTDTIILNAMAGLLADQPQEEWLGVMNAFDIQTSFVTYIEVLTPDDILTIQDGTRIDTTGRLEFVTEAARGAYVSNREQSLENPEDYVLRNAVPIVQNGKTVAILYGVASLQKLSENYTVDIYDGQAFVLGVDGTSGDFLLDTWHNTLRNIEDLNDRTFLMEFTYQEMRQNLQNGVSGNLSTVSQTVGKPVLMHYEPVGVNNWTVCVGVTKDVALASTQSCVNDLYWMAFIVGVTLLGYMLLVTSYLLTANRRVYQASVTDQATGLLNRTAYNDFLLQSSNRLMPQACCIYVDVNGLHELNNRKGHAAGDQMLQCVADSLKKQFSAEDVYRIGGDEFVVLLEEGARAACTAKMQAVQAELEQAGYSIAYGIAARQQERGLDRVVEEADEIMLENKKEYYAARARREPR